MCERLTNEQEDSLEKQIVIGLDEEINRRTGNSTHISTRLLAAGEIIHDLSHYDALVPKGSKIADILPEDKKNLGGLLTDYHHYIRDSENYSLSTITLAEMAAHKNKFF